MSCNNRHLVFAEFLAKQLRFDPSYILDVACGDGRLCKTLTSVFPLARVVGVDPKPRGNRRCGITYLRGYFPDRVSVQDYDLVVGMHPDAATWAIVTESCRFNISFAVVPCCMMHVPSSFHSEWEH